MRPMNIAPLLIVIIIFNLFPAEDVKSWRRTHWNVEELESLYQTSAKMVITSNLIRAILGNFGLGLVHNQAPSSLSNLDLTTISQRKYRELVSRVAPVVSTYLIFRSAYLKSYQI